MALIDSSVRDDFFGLQEKVFFNNAANAPLLKSVRAAIETYLQEIVDLRDGFAQGSQRLEELRRNCGKLINADPAQIGFTTNTSTGLNLAVSGLDWQEGDEVIIADNEFPAVVYPFRELERRGVKIIMAPTDNDDFSESEVAKLVTDHTRLLAVSFVQYFNGYRNDLPALGKLCRERDIFFAVDGIQGVGASPLDVEKCQIDLLACGGQKWLLSLPGCGFCYLSKRAMSMLEPVHTGWMGIDWSGNFTNLRDFTRQPLADARRYSLGTYPFLHLWALEAGTRYLSQRGVEKIFAHNLALLDPLLEYLAGSDFYVLRSPTAAEHRSSFISVGSPSGIDLQNHLLSKGFVTAFREGGVRISVNFYNTEAEIGASENNRAIAIAPRILAHFICFSL
ncbi:MAG: aminotransferase class V-fold PLP-dependent enzyme [bacterium]